MSLEFWIILWKIVLIASVGLFAVLAVIVSIGGAMDIKNLFKVLREEHAKNMAVESDESDET